MRTKFTSYEWEEILSIPPHFIMDPDGWDRANYDASMKEEISLEEYVDRLTRSTCNWGVQGCPIINIWGRDSHDTWEAIAVMGEDSTQKDRPKFDIKKAREAIIRSSEENQRQLRELSPEDFETVARAEKNAGFDSDALFAFMNKTDVDFSEAGRKAFEGLKDEFSKEAKPS